MNATATLPRTGNVTCGVCKASGQTVAHVRECSAASYAAKGIAAKRVNVPTRVVPTAAPVVTAPRVDVNDVPAGRYALDKGNGVVKFYVVDKPTEGRWAGYTFVKHLASDTEYAVRDRTARDIVLKAIAADVQGAMEAFGKLIGRCGHCNRTLTNDESRAVGIGPVCRGRMGW